MIGLKGADGNHNSYLSYTNTQLKGVQTYLFGMSNNQIDIHMSDLDLDEETQALLAKVEADAQSGSNDSKPNQKNKKNEKQTEEIPQSDYSDKDFDEVIEEW